MDCVLSTMFKHYWTCSIVCALSLRLGEQSVQMLTRLAVKKKQTNKQKIKLELGLRATCFFKRVIRF